MNALALYTAPKPRFQGSVNELAVARSIWTGLQGGITVRTVYGDQNQYAYVTRAGQLSPGFAVSADHVEPIERDEYSAEWLAYLS